MIVSSEGCLEVRCVALKHSFILKRDISESATGIVKTVVPYDAALRGRWPQLRDVSLTRPCSFSVSCLEGFDTHV